MNRDTVQTYFSHDHDRIDQCLETYRQMKKTDFATAKNAFKEFKFGLQRHIIWEETVLFPLFEEKTGMRDVGPTAVMRAEHRQIGACLEALHDKVRMQDVDSDLEEQRLLQILKVHNDKEENVLYPAIDRLISEEERTTAFTTMKNLPDDAFKTCCGKHHAVAQQGTPS